MLLLLTKLFASKLARQIGLYALLSLALMLGLRWYTNKAFSDGRSAGVSAALTESVHSSEISWKADLNALQKQIDASHVVAAHNAAASADALNAIQATVTKAADDRYQISKQVAALSASDVTAAVVANDASVKPDDSADLRQHLLESQMTNKDLIDEVRKTSALVDEYHKATQQQIASLTDELTATQGQLHVMTQERDAYKASFEAATKKRGCGSLKKIFTLGICR